MADKLKKVLRGARKNRIRGVVKVSEDRPRLSVFVSNKAVSAQVINDEVGKTLASARVASEKMTMTQAAEKLGVEIAKAAKKAKVSKVVFDRNGRKYHGRVKAVADNARKEGLEL